MRSRNGGRLGHGHTPPLAGKSISAMETTPRATPTDCNVVVSRSPKRKKAMTLISSSCATEEAEMAKPEPALTHQLHHHQVADAVERERGDEHPELAVVDIGTMTVAAEERSTMALPSQRRKVGFMGWPSLPPLDTPPLEGEGRSAAPGWGDVQTSEHRRSNSWLGSPPPAASR